MEWEKGGGKERDGFHGKYDFFTFCLVPGLTLWLASMESWFGTNLSVVCSRGGLRLGFALWGIVTGLYYGFYTFYLFRLGNYRKIVAKGLVLAAGFINSFLELYVVSGLCGFMRYLERVLRKSES